MASKLLYCFIQTCVIFDARGTADSFAQIKLSSKNITFSYIIKYIIFVI